MARLIFMGAEVGSNRTLLESMDVQHMGISYWGITKRGLPKTKNWLVSERFEPGVKVYVESGAHQAVKAGLSHRELVVFNEAYQEFIANNFDRIEAFTEFDAHILGQTWMQEQRDYHADAGDKFWPVWHHEQGPGALMSLAGEYKNIAIPGESIEETTNLASFAGSLARVNGTRFQALATAKPDNLRQVPFETAGTLSWLSPMRRGEVIVWDGTKLVRYQKKMRAQALPRYKAQAAKAGLDVDKFLAGDNVETSRMAVWSYLRLEESMDKKKPGNPFSVIQGGGEVSDNSETPLLTGLMETGVGGSDNRDLEVRNAGPVSLVPREPHEQGNLPVFGFQTKTVVDIDEGGNQVIRDVHVVQSQSASLRQCNTCFVAANCPAFKPDTACAFNLPIEVKTQEQLRGLLNAVLEMQGQRVAFSRFSEELNGGYPDPNTGQEIDRLMKMVKTMKELDDTKESFRITMERQSSGGVLSAIFGDRAAALTQPAEVIMDEDQTTRFLSDSLE